MGSSISQAYTDLELVINGGFVSNNDEVCIRFNGDTSSAYSTTFLFADGSSTYTTRQSNATGINAGRIGSTALKGYSKININNYSNSTTYKTALMKSGGNTGPNGGAGGYNYQNIGMWRNQAPITSITLYEAGGYSWLSGTTFTLYGIKAGGGDSTVKAIGGTITQDSTYYYHTFKGSGTFQPLQSLTADILVVAGGGGAMGAGGGGGGGGLLGFASQSLTAQAYPVIVGAGGSRARPGTGLRTSGSNSQFGSLTTALGGAGGGGYNEAAGAYQPALSGGGSGGGGSYYSGVSFSTGTTGQGNSGSNGYQGTGGGEPRSGGGGGGAGGAAASGSANVGGNGGIGATYNSTVGGTAGPYAFINAMGAASGTGQLSGGNYYYAGGGGGEGKNSRGAAGLGGGGQGGTSEPSVSGDAGTANTGGGAGAGPNTSSSYGGNNGGSGVIIVRYAKA